MLDVELNEATNQRITPGQVLKIVAIDRGSLADIPAWAEDTGNELFHTASEGGRFVFLVRKSEA